ncbi:MAG TPA: MbnP family protein, partial [Bacteroidia bacterium]|nr:MbnP family protein [Bacteroidia bacterium]
MIIYSAGMRSRFIEQLFFILTAIVMLSISCKKDTQDIQTTPQPPSGKVMVSIGGYAGTTPLVYGDVYTNAAGENFKASLFRYYLTNLVLEGEGNTPDYVQPESYYLIDHSGTNALYTFLLNNVPVGT